MKRELPSTNLSISTLRAELLELLAFLLPEKRWPNLVSARELADFTSQAFVDHSTADKEQEALLLAHLIQLKLKARKQR